MSFTLGEQTLVFLEAILLGVGGGICYDVCRALRRVLRVRAAGTAVLDGAFWLLLLGALFYFAVTDAAAQARYYILLGQGLGMSLHLLCFSGVLVPALERMLRLAARLLALPPRAGAAAAAAAGRALGRCSRPVQILKKIKKKLPFLRRSG